MQKFIIKGIFFLVLVTFIFPVVLALWGVVMPDFIKSNLVTNGASGFSEQRLKEVKGSVQPDILILGSSHAYRSFDPRIFNSSGWSLFNLGTSQQTAVQTRFLLNRYLRRIQPKCVVYVVDPHVMSSGGEESAIDLIYSDSLGWDMVDMARKVHHPNVWYALIYRSVTQVMPFLKKDKPPKSDRKDAYIMGGYVSAAWGKKNDQVSPNVTKRTHSEIVSTEFLAVLALLRQQNVPYVLVTTPFTKAYYRNLKPWLDKVDFDRFGLYRDFNQGSNLNDSLHFYDGHHLRQAGVDIFNPLCIEWLRQTGKLPSPTTR